MESISTPTMELEPEKSIGIKFILDLRDYARFWAGLLVFNIGSVIGLPALLFFLCELTSSCIERLQKLALQTELQMMVILL